MAGPFKPSNNSKAKGVWGKTKKFFKDFWWGFKKGFFGTLGVLGKIAKGVNHVLPNPVTSAIGKSADTIKSGAENIINKGGQIVQDLKDGRPLDLKGGIDTTKQNWKDIYDSVGNTVDTIGNTLNKKNMSNTLNKLLK